MLPGLPFADCLPTGRRNLSPQRGANARHDFGNRVNGVRRTQRADHAQDDRSGRVGTCDRTPPARVRDLVLKLNHAGIIPGQKGCRIVVPQLG